MPVSCVLLHSQLLTALPASHVPAAPGFMAAIQRGRPPDWTHHAEQEVGHAQRGWLTLGFKSKQGTVPIDHDHHGRNMSRFSLFVMKAGDVKVKKSLEECMTPQSLNIT